MSIRESGKFLRTNYRLTGGKVGAGELDSIFVIDSFYDSFDNFVTVSMGGYGKPKWLMALGMSAASGAVDASVDHAVLPTQSFSGSIGWLYLFESTGIMTGTARVMYGALIASR